MSKKNLFLNSARVINICYILFLSIFALDAFSGINILENLQALLIHLLPSILVTLSLILAWKKPFFGGLSNILLGLITIRFFNTYKDPLPFLIITLPLVLTGIIYLFSAIKKQSR